MSTITVNAKEAHASRKGRVPSEPLGPTGPVGPTGPLGPTEPLGPTGPLGPSHAVNAMKKIIATKHKQVLLMCSGM